MKYFLQRDGRTYGPYSFDDLKRYQAENRIGPNDLVRREDSQQWEAWQQVLNPAPAPAEPVTPPAAPQQPAFGGGGFGQQPSSVPQVQPQSQPQQPAFGNNPPAFGGGFGQQPPNNPPAFGGGGFGQQQPTPPSYQQPPQDQGFGGGGFGQQAQQAGSEVAGAFGAFGQQAFGNQPPQQGGYGAPAPQFGGSAVGPMPPDMQWWLVLVIGLFCGFFPLYWLWKEASFVQKIDPQNDSKKFYGMGFALLIGGYIVSFMGAFFASGHFSELAMVFPMVGMLAVLAGVVCMILASFKMRASIHNYYTMVEPMGINLMDTTGAVLTFFFAVYFFQYHFANIAMRKKAMGHPAV